MQSTKTTRLSIKSSKEAGLRNENAQCSKGGGNEGTHKPNKQVMENRHAEHRQEAQWSKASQQLWHTEGRTTVGQI